MAFRMAGLQRSKSGAFRARKGIPADIREDYQAQHEKRWEEIFTQPASCPVQRAKVLHSEWEAEIDNRIATLRAKRRGEGHELTHGEAHALAGEWYRWWVSQYEENPVDPVSWEALTDRVTDAIRMATPEWEDDPSLAHFDRAKEPEAKVDWHPVLADEAKTAQFLATKGEVLTPAAMELFLDALLREFLEATDLLRRRADGDYSPDENLKTLPEYRKTKPGVQGSGKTTFELFRDYVETGTAPSTVGRWRVVFRTLDEHLDGRPIDDFTAEEAQRWARSLVTGNRSARTVSGIWVAAARTMLAWALTEKLITANPFAAVTIRAPRKVYKREEGKALSAEEQQVILKAALAITVQGWLPLGTLANGV
jgi:hypothetical protein